MMEERRKLKMAIISGASHALSYKEKNPGSSSEEVIRHVNKEINSILDKIDIE